MGISLLWGQAWDQFIAIQESISEVIPASHYCCLTWPACHGSCPKGIYLTIQHMKVPCGVGTGWSLLPLGSENDNDEASLGKHSLESCIPASVCAEHSNLTFLGGSRKTGRGVNETVMKQLPPYLLAAYKERNRKPVNCRLSEQSALLRTQSLTRGKWNAKFSVPVWLGASWLRRWEHTGPGAESMHWEGDNNNKDNSDDAADYWQQHLTLSACTT